VTRTARHSSLPGFYRKPLATVRVRDAELRQRAIVLRPVEADWEEPGPIEGANVPLSNGVVWLVRYVGHPELGIEVRAADQAFGGYLILRSLLRHLGLDHDRLVWVSDAAMRPHAARRRERSARAVKAQVGSATIG
jgi:hypothetical protein